jgi:hypothetical protein
VKRGVFGRIYGGGVAAIARGVGVSETTAAAIIDALDAMLPELAAWSRTVRDAVKNGQTSSPPTPAGSSTCPPPTRTRRPTTASRAPPASCSSTPSSGWRDTRWADATLLPVHDELVLVVPEAEPPSRPPPTWSPPWKPTCTAWRSKPKPARPAPSYAWAGRSARSAAGRHAAGRRPARSRSPLAVGRPVRGGFAGRRAVGLRARCGRPAVGDRQHCRHVGSASCGDPQDRRADRSAWRLVDGSTPHDRAEPRGVEHAADVHARA